MMATNLDTIKRPNGNLERFKQCHNGCSWIFAAKQDSLHCLIHFNLQRIFMNSWKFEKRIDLTYVWNAPTRRCKNSITKVPFRLGNNIRPPKIKCLCLIVNSCFTVHCSVVVLFPFFYSLLLWFRIFFVGWCYLCAWGSWRIPKQMYLVRRIDVHCEWRLGPLLLLLTIGQMDTMNKYFHNVPYSLFRQFPSSHGTRTDFSFAIQAYGARHVYISSAVFVCRRRLFMCVLIETLYGNHARIWPGDHVLHVLSGQMSFTILIKNSK